MTSSDERRVLDAVGTDLYIGGRWRPSPATCNGRCG